MAIVVDGRELATNPHENLLQVCLSHGLDLPYFCWHPALGAVGACRQCAVKQFRDPQDDKGQLVMACMTAASDGTRISIEDPEARAFRASVIEWLMTNHPHDCPVCQEGGECHLQDMTVMTGHIYRRYRFRKRTHRNQYLGPFITHEMNRCIACYRCVRFYRDYAGGRDLDVLGSHRYVYFGRHADGVLESEFSGNLVEVCPTGVFADKTLSAVYTRKWDLKSAPSVCVHCGVGCNTFVNARYGELRRVINRYDQQINGYFLCDRGRFGHGFVSQPARLRQARRAPAELLEGSAALAQLRSLLKSANPGGDREPGAVIGIGSPRASLESNFALRALVGPERFYAGVADAEWKELQRVLQILGAPPASIATLMEAESADAVLVLGVDLPDTAPRVALALRQSVRQAAFAAAARQNVPGWQDAAVRELGREARSPLFILSADATRLDDAGTALRAAPPDIARLGAAVLHALDPSAARVDELAHDTRVEQIAQALRGAARPLIVSGVGAQHEALLPLAAAIAGALTRLGRAAQLLLTVPECNSLGLALLGALPLSGALDALRSAGAHTLLVLENDLYRRAARAAVDAALQGTRHLVVLDHTRHATVERAELVLPAATFAESSGTLVNYEARAQRFFQLLFPEDEVRASWRWLDELRCSLHPDAAPRATLDEQIAVIASELPVLAAVRAAAPSAELRIAGSRIASAPHRESGRTAMYADRSVHEPAPPPYPDGPYSNSMEGYYGTMPAALYPYFWAPAWNSEQGLNKFQQEVGGPLRGGPAGVRLFGGETARATRQPAPMIPPAFAPRAAEWLLVASPRVFGSEELSAHAPAVGERLSPAALELNPQDAMLLGVQQGEQIELQAQDMNQRLTVQLHPALVSGVAGVSVGLPGEPYLSFPAWGRLRKPNP